MSLSRKGRHAGAKNHMYGKSGPLAPHYGIPMSDEAKQKAGAAIRAAHEAGLFASQYKNVAGVDSDGVVVVFDSIAQAAEAVGIPATNISRVCKGKRKHAAGYVWIYVKEADDK